EGSIDVTVFLPTDAVGRPIGTLDDPIPADLRAPGISAVGTWPGARRVPCQGMANPGEVCVPGGAFWMGNPLLSVGDATRQRLVVLSPFFIDSAEVTVA